MADCTAITTSDDTNRPLPYEYSDWGRRNPMGWGQEPHGLGAGGTLKFYLVLFSLYSVLLTAGSILDPSYEIWEEKGATDYQVAGEGGGGRLSTPLQNAYKTKIYI